jgi:uncharacterized protein (TIGR02466 family)
MSAPGARFRISPAFAVPFVQVDHPSPQALNAALRSLFLAREGEGATYRNAAPTMEIRDGLFESRFDLFQWPESAITDLRGFCWSALFKTVAELNGYSPEEMNRLEVRSDAWFHITRRGGYFAQHNHPMASWSGVYSVDDGDDRSGQADSGTLVFSHPVATANAFVDLACIRLQSPWGIRPLNVRLKPGQLVLFPSWLMHQVLPFQGEGTRITVAFNAWFRQRQAA